MSSLINNDFYSYIFCFPLCSSDAFSLTYPAYLSRNPRMRSEVESGQTTPTTPNKRRRTQRILLESKWFHPRPWTPAGAHPLQAPLSQGPTFSSYTLLALIMSCERLCSSGIHRSCMVTRAAGWLHTLLFLN